MENVLGYSGLFKHSAGMQQHSFEVVFLSTCYMEVQY